MRAASKGFVPRCSRGCGNSIQECFLSFFRSFIFGKPPKRERCPEMATLITWERNLFGFLALFLLWEGDDLCYQSARCVWQPPGVVPLKAAKVFWVFFVWQNVKNSGEMFNLQGTIVVSWECACSHVASVSSLSVAGTKKNSLIGVIVRQNETNRKKKGRSSSCTSSTISLQDVNWAASQNYQ